MNYYFLKELLHSHVLSFVSFEFEWSKYNQVPVSISRLLKHLFRHKLSNTHFSLIHIFQKLIVIYNFKLKNTMVTTDKFHIIKNMRRSTKFFKQYRIIMFISWCSEQTFLRKFIARMWLSQTLQLKLKNYFNILMLTKKIFLRKNSVRLVTWVIVLSAPKFWIFGSDGSSNYSIIKVILSHLKKQLLNQLISFLSNNKGEH